METNNNSNIDTSTNSNTNRNMSESSKKPVVAIIGAGPSGLVSAKYALEYGLRPVVFEKSSHISGKWSAKNAAFWIGLRSNTTRFLSRFSDHPWPKDTRLHPFVNEINDYLSSYARRFDLGKHILLRHKVTFVKSLGDKSWEVTYQNLVTRETTTEKFDFVIVASGAFQRPYIPKEDNMDSYSGLIIHSSDFRFNDSRLKLKNVVVVGGTLSGVEISANLVGHVGAVYHVFEKSPVVLPLLWKLKLDGNKYSILPYECLLFSRSASYLPEGMSKEEFSMRNRQMIKQIASFQADKNPGCPEDLHVDFDNPNEPLTLTLSDSYLDQVKDNKITPIKSRITKFFENGILFDNGQYVATDAVIFCTGFRIVAAEYLDKPTLEAMRYDENSQQFPVLLYKETFAPGLETLAYVGLNEVSCFTGYEMQARWAISVFAGKVPPPDPNRVSEFVKELEAMRNDEKANNTLSLRPHAILVDNYAEELGLKPDLEAIKQENEELFDYLWNDGVYWSHFLFDKPNKESFIDMMKEVRDYRSKVYVLKPNENEITQSEVIKQFSKHYSY